MEISGRYGNRDLAMNTSTIDTTVYMVCEMAEAEFGPKFIDRLAEDIQLTQVSYNRKKALEYMVNELIHKHLVPSFRNMGKSQVAGELNELKPLTEKTYVDYFVRLTTLERHTTGTPLQKACANMAQMLAGYTTENPFPVCQVVVNYFAKTQNPEGLYNIIAGLCVKIRADQENWSV